MTTTAIAPVPVASPRTRTLGLVATELAFVVAVTAMGRYWATNGHLRIPLVGVAALFAAGGMLVFHIEFKREAHSFSFSELALILCLFFASPGDLLIGRLLGEAVALAFRPRQAPIKLLVNLTTFTCECVVAMAVFHGMFHAPAVDDAIGWVAAFTAVVVADLVSALTVGCVITWHGGRPDLLRLTVAAMVLASANSSLGIVAALLIDVNVAALALLGIVAGTLFLAYRGYARLAERYASLRVLHDFSEAIGSVVETRDVTEAMLYHARRLLRADVAELIVLCDKGAHTRTRLAGPGPAEHLPLDANAAAVLAALPRHQVISRTRGDRTPSAIGPYAQVLGHDDFLVVRLDVSEVTCVLGVAGRLADVSTFDEEDCRVFSTLSNHAAVAFEKGRLIDQLQIEAAEREHQALHDDLTGLANRRHFIEACSWVLSAPGAHEVAVVLIDLDRFKEINDTLGHEVGDDLLIEISRRLGGVMRKGHLIARLGGDEYAALLTDVDESTAVNEARRMLATLREPINLRGLHVELRASAGIAFAPQHGTEATALLQHADVAMYLAKKHGSGVEIYSVDADHHSPRRLRLAGQLRRAIHDREMVAHFQPKADLRTGRIVGAEALVRWYHPTLGHLSPDEFVEVAEQSGLIDDLTFSVLRQSLHACRRWRTSGHDVDIAVNVAAASLLGPTFPDEIAGLLAEANLPPNVLTLEITESGIMADTDRAHDALQRIAACGVKLSIDDFGTGYSSLAYLQELPVDELKVDRSFVFKVSDDDGARAIVQSVVELGHSLGLTVVAEGVENQRAWDHLVEIGCDVGQGYILSRPIPKHEIQEWLDRRDRIHTQPPDVAAVRRVS